MRHYAGSGKGTGRMKTPICDFVRNYAESAVTRLHMPGHKGKGFLGIEYLDLTEIEGADVLYHENGILAESQKNARELFNTKRTLYSTEGSTLAIRAMLTLAVKYAKHKGKRPIIAAGRNAHKAFLTSCALLDLAPIWLFPDENPSFLSCTLTANDLKAFLQDSDEKPTALYITNPDYLGNFCDVRSLSEICKKNDILFLVDNAHGAYLHFLPEEMHPMDLGADLCCDSAHKTLPVLTGGAYLHVGKDAPDFLAEEAESAMKLFASTSPSYLTLQSLDACNAYLADGYREKLNVFADQLFQTKKELRRHGYSLTGAEPLKITVMPKSYGYTGDELADILRQHHFECEFSDPDFLVLMLTPENGTESVNQLKNVLLSIPQRDPILQFPPRPTKKEACLSLREAMLSPSEKIEMKASVGRILSEPGTVCPPAIPIVLCGERITEKDLISFAYYGIESVRVVQ